MPDKVLKVKTMRRREDDTRCFNFRVSINDYGYGGSAKVIERILKPFFQYVEVREER